jgi:hypothetical protein
MKKNGLSKMKLAILGLLIGLAVLLVAGCKEPEPEPEWEPTIFDTTWTYNDGGTLTFAKGKFELKNKIFFTTDTQKMDYQGRYTVKDDVATMTNWQSRPAGTKGAWSDRNYTGYATITNNINGTRTLNISSDPPPRSFFGSLEEIIPTEALEE